MKHWNGKVKAGALQYVLVIAIIIFIVLFAFVQLINLQQKLGVKKNLYQKAVLQADNGFRYLASKSIENNTIKKVQFSENDQEEVTIEQKYWGIFDVAKITSKVNKETIKKVALIGNRIKDKKALYLVENNVPLVLVGHTKIIGKSYLSQRGVKPGNIAGNSFYGNTLIQGTTQQSETSLPKNKRIKEVSERFSFLNKIQPNFELREGLKIVQSFYSKTLSYQDYLTIKLEDISLKGNIIITSSSKIIVKKTATLEDIILIAPEVKIESGFQGNIQVFANQKIQVEESVKLQYPSALILNYKKEKIESEDGIFINSRSDIRGVLAFLKKDDTKINYQPQIKLDSQVHITGEVYCEGNLELLGNVSGEVYAKNFITIQFGSKYINHIYNGSINANNLVNQYVGLGLQSNQKSVAKWLY
ncbi:hypothetical protein [Tenacibaculum jejuense]|uniref:Uncharacterized protein n=1 Tax=Tenacibaculum jejuense TaxID=584609 RepID=A0A238U8C9_9FLAO|nr:hypothetical protein [Tenacibaculum jejuense]SNR15449.1 conserved protein of unknown function [Tenacibaculum jejuense]